MFFLWRVAFQGKVLLPLDEVSLNEPWRSETPNLASPPVWNPIITDSVWQSYPLASVANKLRQQGSYFWDPYTMSGLPSFARGDMFSHPIFFVLSRFLSTAQAMSWSAVFALALGAFLPFFSYVNWGAAFLGR